MGFWEFMGIHTTFWLMYGLTEGLDLKRGMPLFLWFAFLCIVTFFISGVFYAWNWETAYIGVWLFPFGIYITKDIRLTSEELP